MRVRGDYCRFNAWRNRRLFGCPLSEGIFFTGEPASSRDQLLCRRAIVSANSATKSDSMSPTIGTAGIRYRRTSRVWAAAAGTIEAAHIAITIPARAENPGRRRRTAVTIQNITVITKAADRAWYR